MLGHQTQCDKIHVYNNNKKNNNKSNNINMLCIKYKFEATIAGLLEEREDMVVDMSW